VLLTTRRADQKWFALLFILSGPGVSAVALGWEHTCFLLNSGGVKCCGYNGHGELGIGGTSDNNYSPISLSLSSGLPIQAWEEFTCHPCIGPEIQIESELDKWWF
jgi:hypothetical protein